MKKAVQYFSAEALELGMRARPDDIARFLEDFRLLHGEAQKENVGKSRLISMKIDELLLQAFRSRCELSGIKYQTQIKKLMREWLLFQESP